MSYKALISDLDGTLIPNKVNGMPSQKIINCINEAKKEIHISVATGRSYWQAKPILEALELNDPVILLNGALIIHDNTKQPLYERPLLKKDFRIVTELLRKTTFRFVIDTKDKTYEDDHDFSPSSPLTIFVWDLKEGQANILIRKLSHIPTLSLYKVNGWREGTVGLNISHKLATKQHAILQLAKILRIKTHEIIGIGDGPNDFPLLMASGLKVAMGNAIPDLKAIADHVTSTVDKDGVAEVIKEYILKKRVEIKSQNKD